MEFRDAKSLIKRILLENSNNDYDVLIDVITCDESTLETVCKIYDYLKSLINIDYNMKFLMRLLDSIEYHKNPNYDKPKNSFIEACKLRKIWGNREMAEYYENSGADKKYVLEMTKKHYFIAANDGMDKAQYKLGKIYAKEGNISQADQWYNKPPALKYPGTYCALGDLYAESDIMKSIKYYKLAIKQKDSNAEYYFNKCLKENKNYATVNNLINEIEKLKMMIKA
jgi:TPR repeat protein